MTDQSLSGKILDTETCDQILTSPDIDVLPLLNAAYEIRKKYHGKVVSIHIINNTQNGYCPEDCHYCAQAKSSQANIEEYPIKPDAEILAEAKQAYESGAFRYCMVFAGRGPSTKRTEHLAKLIREIKATYPLEVCVSAGLLDREKAQVLKDAGLDRLNHNLNTSEKNYPNICTTHTYEDRLNTLKAAKDVGIEVCSGMIVGLGEKAPDIVEIAKKLREVKAKSIPINLLVSIEGTALKEKTKLTPEYCLRVLCLFRFLNPEAEIRIAAGREIHLRDMEVLSLYAANSLFIEGYLNTKGSSRLKTLTMIRDAGFTINSDQDLTELLNNETSSTLTQALDEKELFLKNLRDLRPFLEKNVINSARKGG
ncbi:MAG: biotin synthase BioB [Candidatus Omnitrophica bacterium]|nr:biotin synthase BioB [Candidatus Omnitrophota bacterium]